MQAGRLNSRCVIQAPSTATDEIGQPIPGWDDVATVWGNIRVLNGVESIKAASPVSVVKASIRIRYRTGVTAGMRVLHNLVGYNITSVQPDVSGREFVDLVCERTA